MPIANELTINTSASALDMANAIFGDGITVTSASFQGDAVQSGIYNGALSTIAGIVPTDTGVILSTGNVTDFTNSSGTTDTNTVAGRSSDPLGGIDGDAQLNAVAGMATFDGAILNASFIPTGDMLTMQFVFSSEEYPEYVNGGVNDAFGVWINGSFVPATISVAGNISIDSVNGGVNQNLYRDNTADQFNTEMDGFTYVLSFKAPVTPGQVNTIKIGIADGGDSAFDSNLLIMGNSIQTFALAMDDTIQLTANSSRTFDILANDRDETDAGLTITHINGTAVVSGQVVTLATGEKVRLNADGTVTVFSDGDPGTNALSYTVLDTQGNTDVGFIFVETVAVTGPDGIVQGTAGNDVIQVGYLGDPDGDRIDNNDGQGIGGTTADADYVLAGAGNDSITANLGNDIIYAGAGHDTAFGGAGNDTIYGDGGNDNLSGGNDNDLIYGGAGHDQLAGDAGDDTLFGGAAADTITIGLAQGTDSVQGGETGADFDTLGLTAASNVSITLTGNEAGVASYAGGGGATFSQIERIVTGAGNDFISAVSDATGLVLETGAGNDTIVGGSGNDTVYGGDGNETLNGGAGNDALYGGGDNDVFFVSAGFGQDTVIGGQSGTNYDTLDLSGLTNPVTVVFTAPGTGVVTDTVTGHTVTFSEIEQLILTQQAYVVDASLNNGYTYIQALGGNDQITGSAGNDIFDDEMLAPNGQGNDTFYGGGGNDVLWMGINDDLAFGGTGDDSLGGEEGDDVLHGDAGNDSLNGHSGNDTLYGGTGGDSMLGGAGADLLYGDDDSDTLRGDVGNDTLFGGMGNDSLSAGAGDDWALGEAGHDTLSGDAGNDYLDGGDGDDVVYGGAGNDLLTDGDTGNDLLYGGNDDDRLSSNSGADTLDGGVGNDQLFANSNPDTVTLDGGDGDDSLLGSWAAGGDLLSGGAGNDYLVGNGGNDTIDAGIGDDFVDAGDNDDTVQGGAGNDTLDGALGADTLDGGVGNDSLRGGDGNDMLIGGDGADTLQG
jgi:Ca2+-binding RTX toxin-like protein